MCCSTLVAIDPEEIREYGEIPTVSEMIHLDRIKIKTATITLQGAFGNDVRVYVGVDCQLFKYLTKLGLIPEGIPP